MASPVIAITYSSPSSAIYPNNSQLQLSAKRPAIASHGAMISYLRTARKAKRAVITCARSSSDDPAPARQAAASGRRDLLLGLGGAGLYGATGALIDPYTGVAFGTPIDGPSMDVCKPASASDTVKVECCPSPPFTGNSYETFKFPDPLQQPMRTRRPAHLASQDKDFVAKYEKAIKLMKCLPDDDPCSFVQQARIHCAYCNGSYVQANAPDKGFQVHYSWFFLPFHRIYLYFYERILGSLIDDPTFALPYWNWDYEPGMNIPDMFVANAESPLFDGRRNVAHFPPSKPLDLNWVKRPETCPEDKAIADIVRDNYHTISKRTDQGAKTPRDYYGAEFRAGEVAPSQATAKITAGSAEMLHNMAHIWTGTTSGLNEDMGNFASAGRDPIFFCHHSNVDRLWNIWKSIDPATRTDFDDNDYRKASFLFYDENRKLIKVKVEDVMDNAPLLYEYEDSPTPWRDAKGTPTPINAARKAQKGQLPRKQVDPAKLTPLSAFPVALDKVVSVTVARPRVGARSAEEKKKTSEILVVEGIQLGGDKAVSFDILVNDDPDAPSGPSKSEFAGTFINVPHVHDHATGDKLTIGFRMDITELLEDIGAEKDADLLVTFVPKMRDGPIAIGGVRIELAS